MARQYSDDERAAILAKSYALLARDVTDTRQVSSEPEWADEEIRQLAFERPAGDWRRHGREFDEWKAQKAAEAKMETLKQLEVRIDAKIAAATDRVFNAIAEVVATGIYEPYDKKSPSCARRSKLCASVALCRSQPRISISPAS